MFIKLNFLEESKYLTALIVQVFTTNDWYPTLGRNIKRKCFIIDCRNTFIIKLIIFKVNKLIPIYKY